MAKRKAKFRLPPGFGIFLGETTVKRAQQLIRGRNLTDKNISSEMAKEGLRISPPCVSALRHSMGMPALYHKGLPLSVEIVNRAKQLIAERKLDDHAIARLMKKENFRISAGSVRMLRVGVKLPALPRLPTRPLSPKVVNRVRQLIAERKLNDSAIARLMASESLLISVPSVGKIRRSMGVSPGVLLQKEAQMRANQLKKFRLEFKALSRERIIVKWDRLKKTEQIIKTRRAELRKLKDKERIGTFLNQLGEIQVQLEALFLFLPKEVQQAEAARFVKAAEAMKKKQ